LLVIAPVAARHDTLGFARMKDRHMAATSKGDRSAESRRTLDRIASETDPGGFAGRTVLRARDHREASDADWAEVWGTRIGRAIGILITVAVIAWALSLLFAGA
jgi:hypothetical protein